MRSQDYVDRAAQIIKQYGVAIQYVFPTKEGEETFAYTAGLEQNYNHPEVLIVCPIKAEIAQALLNEVHDLIKEGQKLVPGQRDDRFLEGMDVVFRSVDEDRTEDYTTMAHGFAKTNLGRKARVLQMVLPDQHNHMPWDDGYDAKKMAMQHLLFPMTEE